MFYLISSSVFFSLSYIYAQKLLKNRNMNIYRFTGLNGGFTFIVIVFFMFFYYFFVGILIILKEINFRLNMFCLLVICLSHFFQNYGFLLELLFRSLLKIYVWLILLRNSMRWTQFHWISLKQCLSGYWTWYYMTLFWSIPIQEMLVIISIWASRYI